MQEAFWSLRTTTSICLGLLVAGLLFDLSTTQRLVVAIIYNIPIALSGLALSRRLTLWVLVLALLANIAAAYTNTLQANSFDQISLLNRALAGLSMLLVGLLTLAIDRASVGLSRLHDTTAALDQERHLRHLLIELSKYSKRQDFLQHSVQLLHPFLEAETVHLVAVRDDHFIAPHVKSPEHNGFIQLGESADWATETLPVTSPAVVSVRTDAGVTTIGRLEQHEGDDLLIIVGRPKTVACSQLLGEVLAGLEPLLERSD